MENETLGEKLQRSDNVLIAARFKRLVPRLDEAVCLGDLSAICGVRDQMKQALIPLPMQIGQR